MRREWDVVRTLNIIHIVWLFSIAVEPKQGVLSAKLCFAPKTTMRREWDVVRTRNVNQPNDKGENKEYRAYALACDRDDYIFDCAMKNPTPATNKKGTFVYRTKFVLFFLTPELIYDRIIQRKWNGGTYVR